MKQFRNVDVPLAYFRLTLTESEPILVPILQESNHYHNFEHSGECRVTAPSIGVLHARLQGRVGAEPVRHLSTHTRSPMQS